MPMTTGYKKVPLPEAEDDRSPCWSPEASPDEDDVDDNEREVL